MSQDNNTGTNEVEPQASENRHWPHIELVGMLFALTVAKIAEHFYDSVNEKDIGLPIGLTEIIKNVGPIYTHLLLALIVVIASWIAWARSTVFNKISPAVDVFSKSTVILAIDVILVILYLFLTETREILIKTKSIVEISAVSFFPEARVLLAIFFGYLVWNICAGRRLKNDFNLYFISLVCLTGVSIPLFSSFYWPKAHSEPYRTMFIDAALMCVALMFRVVGKSKSEDSRSIIRTCPAVVCGLGYLTFLLLGIFKS